MLIQMEDIYLDNINEDFRFSEINTAALIERQV